MYIHIPSQRPLSRIAFTISIPRPVILTFEEIPSIPIKQWPAIHKDCRFDDVF